MTSPVESLVGIIGAAPVGANDRFADLRYRLFATPAIGDAANGELPLGGDDTAVYLLPVRHAVAVVCVATGFDGTHFGTPNGVRVQPATGFDGTQFGTPASSLSHSATGFDGTQFGAASNARAQPASGFVVTNFGAASSNRTQHATGFDSTQFGVPATLGHNASGFNGTHFGAASNARAQPATGFLATHFGAASNVRAQAATGFFGTNFGAATGLKTQGATGFLSTAFGIPSIPLVSTGFLTTLLGAVTSTNLNIEYDFGPSTMFGTPSTPFDQAQSTTGAELTTFPIPAAVVDGVVLTPTTFKAGRGARATKFGAAAALRSAVETATGFAAINFGAPAYHPLQAVAASGAAGTSFGLPVAVLGPHSYTLEASGADGTSFGLAVMGMTVNPFGAMRTRFGTTTFTLPGAHRAYGLNQQPGFGRASARNEFRYPTTGAAPSTNVGTPGATISHKARMTSPGTHLGVPLVKRNPTC